MARVPEYFTEAGYREQLARLAAGSHRCALATAAAYDDVVARSGRPNVA